MLKHRRSQEFVLGAEGAEIETPKAPRGKGMGRGCPLPSQLGGLGSVVSSPSGVRAEHRPQTSFGVFRALKNT